MSENYYDLKSLTLLGDTLDSLLAGAHLVESDVFERAYNAGLHQLATQYATKVEQACHVAGALSEVPGAQLAALLHGVVADYRQSAQTLAGKVNEQMLETWRVHFRGAMDTVGKIDELGLDAFYRGLNLPKIANGYSWDMTKTIASTSNSYRTDETRAIPDVSGSYHWDMRKSVPAVSHAKSWDEKKSVATCSVSYGESQNQSFGYGTSWGISVNYSAYQKVDSIGIGRPTQPTPPTWTMPTCSTTA